MRYLLAISVAGCSAIENQPNSISFFGTVPALFAAKSHEIEPVFNDSSMFVLALHSVSIDLSW